MAEQDFKTLVLNTLTPLAEGRIANRLCQGEETPEGWILTFDVSGIPPEERKTWDTEIRKLLAQTFPNINLQVRYSTGTQQTAPTPSPHKHPKATSSPSVPTPQPIPGIKAIVAVASGKGGVGKSAVAALLAVACSRLGLKTALLDADIYGPSQAQTFGIQEKPQGDPSSDKIAPIMAGPIALMSFSFFMDPLDPVIWRGPMITKVLQQFFFEVAWGEQDILIVDLPPGTGDVQLSLTQFVPLAGGIIVTTPQQISVIDAIKGCSMFHKLGIPVMGVIENMSLFVCPTCHTSHPLFQSGGGDRVAKIANTEVIARLPLHPDLCAYLDSGRAAEAFRALPSIQKTMTAVAKTVATRSGIEYPSDAVPTSSHVHRHSIFRRMAEKIFPPTS